jgi:hypothetical protein
MMTPDKRITAKISPIIIGTNDPGLKSIPQNYLRKVEMGHFNLTATPKNLNQFVSV